MIKSKKLLIAIGCILFISIHGFFWVTKKEQEVPRRVAPEPETHRPPPRKQSVLDGHGGFSSVLPRLQHVFKPEPLEYTAYREQRREAIKDAFLHGWQGYKTYALGHDELRPITNETYDPFGGWGATMIDSLSTLLVMGLDSEVSELVPLIRKIDFMVDEDINVFESVIRYLGGLLSAYDLTERRTPMYLNQAEKLAQALLPAFDTPSGLPTHLWNPVRNMSIQEETLIAEAGTIQLEFMMLSQFTGNDIYIRKAQAITDLFDTMGYEHGMYIQGLYPTAIDTEKGIFRDETSTFGAMGDSAFEYFLKQHLLTDGKKTQYGRMYLESIRSMKQYMLRQIPGYDMLLLPPFDTEKEQADDSMDHLTCFVPGMLAMGSKTFNEPEDMEIAKGLLETCVFMYRTTKTGLSAERWYIDKHEKYNPLTYNKSQESLEHARDWWYEKNGKYEKTKKMRQNKTEYDIQYQLPKVRARPDTLYFEDERYLLRPETVESLFILYRMTGEQRYQEYGWEIFRSIEQWCKTESAFAAIQDVDQEKKEGNQIDSMESFLFAETFKYLYLLFSPPDTLSLDKFVLNTEAHPFIRRHWNWDGI